MPATMFVVRYEDSNLSLDTCLVFINGDEVTKETKKEVLECAKNCGIKDPAIESETTLEDVRRLSDIGLYEMQGYVG